MKKLIVFIVLLFYLPINAQITLIPDPGFESRLILFGIDSDGVVNGQVLTSDVENVTSLHLTEPYHTIFDLTGIEDFLALESLEVWQQDFTSIDLTNNVNLTFLNLSTLPITNIDLTNNIYLVELSLSIPISELDLSVNTNLEIVGLNGTLLTEINMSQNTALRKFRVFTNHELHYINLQNNNNEGVLSIVEVNFSNENMICIQVDDPVAVMAGDPPYQFWDIDESISISDNCGVFSVEDMELATLINVYPNPVSDYLTIENNSMGTIETLKIYDALGKLVLELENPVNTIDISSLASGLLYVKIITATSNVTKKIIKQ